MQPLNMREACLCLETLLQITQQWRQLHQIIVQRADVSKGYYAMLSAGVLFVCLTVNEGDRQVNTTETHTLTLVMNCSSLRRVVSS